LLERTLCPRAEFNGLANDLGLMPLDVYDAINEWADEQLGDFLLDGDDPITVHKELTIPELYTHESHAGINKVCGLQSGPEVDAAGEWHL